MSPAAPAPALSTATAAVALQFVPVELPQPERLAAPSAAQPDIRIELQRGGLHVKLQCASNAGAQYAAQLRALADASCVA
jgi:hypothetical protein